MKVSICITYHNRKKLLEKTLDSIIKSKYINDTEILSPPYTYSKMDFVRHKILDFIGDIHITDFEIKVKQ